MSLGFLCGLITPDTVSNKATLCPNEIELGSTKLKKNGSTALFSRNTQINEL